MNKKIYLTPTAEAIELLAATSQMASVSEGGEADPLAPIDAPSRQFQPGLL